jgi:hypothetical protein
MQKYELIAEKKLTTPASKLCKGYPKEFEAYMNLCRQLRFDETPDYTRMRQLFRYLLCIKKQKVRFFQNE